MDMSPDYDLMFFVNAVLPSASESLRQVAERLANLLEALSTIDPLLCDFFHPTSLETRVHLTKDVQALEKLIYAQSCFNGASAPKADFGYCLGASTRPQQTEFDPRRITLMMKAGGESVNKLWFQTDPILPDKRLVSYHLIKKLLFATADAFGPVYSSAYPVSLDRDLLVPQGRQKRPFMAGWMVLLPPELARQITPPSAAITQTREDGSLFMAATDEMFDAANPKHVGICKAMQDAIAPINDWSLLK